mgnify:CR=1 FL=1
MSQIYEDALAVLNEVKRAIAGKDSCIYKVFAAILAGGHVLIEDVPGVGKTTLAVAFSRVMGHEQEHVANAFNKAAQENGKVLQASVTLKTAVCPECGRTYVAGGQTTTRIKYSNEENPYVKQLKSIQADALKGRNFDVSIQ